MRRLTFDRSVIVSWNNFLLVYVSVDFWACVGEEDDLFWGFLFGIFVLIPYFGGNWFCAWAERQSIWEAPQAEPAALEVEQSAQSEFDLPMGDMSNPVLPTSMYIKKLDRTIPILNPSSRAVSDLDTALLEGVVRHPDSAHMAQDGNVFILGHSSYLPSVMNKNFQAFNGIQDLAWGDKIEVTSDNHVLIYEVEKVYKASAEDVTVPVSGTGPRLTLATCNSFGGKDDRFIVEAKRIEVRAL
jgi:LPXTG-site transpeptidase (sortase) family protein